MYVKASPGDTEQFAQKKHLEGKFRNAYEGTMANCLENGQNAFFSSMYATHNATPDRLVSTVTIPALVAQSEALEAAKMQHVENVIQEQKRLSPTLDSDFKPTTPAPRKNGLFSVTGKINDLVLDHQHTEEE